MGLTCIDLFCGCGGMTAGLVKAGIDVKIGIDCWDKAIETYNNNFDHLGICKDLRSYSPDKLREEHQIDEIDLIVGGPPCQGFSMAGKRNSNDPRNSLFMEFVKYIQYYKPKAFIMENVVGILTMKMENGSKAIDVILEQLRNGYNCNFYKLLASDFEVPQNRRRVIFIGFREDLNIEPTCPEKINPNNHIPVSTILTPRDQVDESYYLSEKALAGIQRKKEIMKERKHGFGAQFLKLDKPSYTIPARYWKDGYDALVKYSDTEVRRLTVEELKKIQSFPDTFYFEGSKKDSIIQIGNAVPSQLAYYLGKYINEKLNNIKTKTK